METKSIELMIDTNYCKDIAPYIRDSREDYDIIIDDLFFEYEDRLTNYHKLDDSIYAITRLRYHDYFHVQIVFMYDTLQDDQLYDVLFNDKHEDTVLQIINSLIDNANMLLKTYSPAYITNGATKLEHITIDDLDSVYTAQLL